MSSGKRICLFGGTFDPIHNAHLQIANEAQKRFGLHQVLFVPAANPPHKDGIHLTPFEDRFLMVQLACGPYPKFSASRLEEGEQRSYTIDTLERFRPQLKSDDELFFLIGADAFDELKTWKRWQDVLKLTRFIVVSRPGRTYQIPDGASVLRLDDLQLPVASTTIRSRLQLGQPTPELPAAVRQFIDAHGLYKAEDEFYCEAQK
jgi:nicotinate-nucleotide adenylyltransferase